MIQPGYYASIGSQVYVLHDVEAAHTPIYQQAQALIGIEWLALQMPNF